MIQTTNESPTVWSVDELMARLDHDCYLTVTTGRAVVILTEEPDSVEAVLQGDDLQSLISKYRSQLRYLTALSGVVVIFGSKNAYIKSMMNPPSPSIGYTLH